MTQNINSNKEYMRLKRLVKRYKSENKRDALKDYILAVGGLNKIKEIFGSVGIFFKYLGPGYHDIFSKQYLKRAEKQIRDIYKNYSEVEKQ